MTKKWTLEGYLSSQADSLQHVELKVLPALVGRDPSLPIAIVRKEISRKHAEFFQRDGALFLRDFNSTNGTFINHEPIKGERQLHHGDVIHFASCEVRLLEDSQCSDDDDDGTMTRFSVMPLSNRLPTGLNELQSLIEEKAVSIEFQPIVSCRGELYGYEVLGRGAHPELPKSPMPLFRIAESMPGKASELSHIFRLAGAEHAMLQGVSQRLFLNTHPEELKDPEALLSNVLSLQKQYPQLLLVLEIHEDAITDVNLMKSFAERLLAANIELAYDDFGAGQARLMEMSEVPVAYVKFDIALIRDLHKAPEAKRKMVAALAAMTRAIGIKALAEGVEGEDELGLCEQMQFDLIQGYFFAKPNPSIEYTNPFTVKE